MVVLGDELATDLFGKDDPVGKTVQINQSTFLVVGVMQPKVMMGMYSGPDKDQATIPATTFKAMFTDAQDRATWSTSRRAPRWPTRPRPQIYRVLGPQVPLRPRRRRARSASGTRARTSASPATSRSASRSSSGIIGALTLFVGGMGVANIMYAVVKERTREIGVKMALGAKVRQVMSPFVLEALVMTVIGGVAGHRRVAGAHGRHRRRCP